MTFRNKIWKILNHKIYLDELISTGFLKKLRSEIIHRERKRLTSSASVSLIVHIILIAAYFGLSELEKQIEPPLREITFIDLSEETITEFETPQNVAANSNQETPITQEVKPELVVSAGINKQKDNPIIGKERIFLDTKRKQVPIRIERVEPVANNLVNPNDVLKLSLAKGIKNDDQVARPLQFDLNKKLTLKSNSSGNTNLPVQVDKNTAIDLGGNRLSQKPIAYSSVKIKKSIPPQINLDETKAKPKTTQTFITGPLSNRTILHKSIPQFPLWAKRQGVGATISIKFTVMESGKVKEIAIVQHTSGSSDWDQLVVKALKQWKFAALEKTDIRHDQTGVITFQFVI